MQKLTLSRSNRIESVYALWLLLPAAIMFTMFTIVPLIMSGVLSFSNWHVTRLYTPSFDRGLSNYIRLFQDEIFKVSLKNTLIFAFATSILKTVAGVLLALVMIRSIKWNSVFRTIFYMPCVLSPLVVGVLFKSVLQQKGLLNNALALIGVQGPDWLAQYGTAMGSLIVVDSWMWTGFCMFIFISGLQAIPKDYYEYAQTEGVGAVKQFFYITLPLLISSFTVVFTLNLTGGLRSFDMVYVLTNGGPGFSTQVLSTYTYRAFGQGQLAYSATASIVLAIVVVLISFVINRLLKNKEVEM